MTRKLPATDVVIIGLGWTGSILAHELSAAGLNVVAIERGPWRDTASEFQPAYAQDELRYHIRHDLFLRPAQETMTFRNNANQTALPMRSWQGFMPGNGVGGGGLHWNGQTWRFNPTDFVLKTHLTERYGKKFLPEDMTIQDWGITYDELEPHYDKFEYLCGISGKAGNLKGQKQAGGNPFEGPRSREYPTPPQQQPYASTLFAQAAKEMGLSYKKAWAMVDALNTLGKGPYVITQKGGTRGGGTVLTETAKNVMQAYKRLNDKLLAALAEEPELLSLI